MLAGQQGLLGQFKASGWWGGNHHGFHRRIAEHLLKVAAAGQLRGAAGLIHPFLAWMPQGYWHGLGAGPQRRDVHLFAKAQTSNGDSKGAWSAHQASPCC